MVNPLELDEVTIKKLETSMESEIKAYCPQSELQVRFRLTKSVSQLRMRGNTIHHFEIHAMVHYHVNQGVKVGEINYYPTDKVIEVSPYVDEGTVLVLNEQYCRKFTRNLQAKLNQGTLI